MRLRIGIDVGGTNTDAVVVDEAGRVLASVKTATTVDPFDGIRNALSSMVAEVDASAITQAMLGTTHPINAIIQRRGLERVGVLRLAAPATLGARPGAGWPDDLVEAVLGHSAIIGGGHEYDGSEIAPLDEGAVRAFAAEVRDRVTAVAVSAPFSPVNREHELRAAEILAEELGPNVPISKSHEVGAIGLIERENAVILNASLLGVAREVVHGFRRALAEQGLSAEVYLTQNDGTLMTAETALKFPVLTLGSGPTNSMRGACRLAGLDDAVVVDVGGTSTDIGILIGGFPRESTAAEEIGGVRTNFRMPDLVSFGLGGGTVVRTDGGNTIVGPDSVGHRVVEDALVRGGEVLTMSDISVRAGRLTGFGDASLVASLDPEVVEQAFAWGDEQIKTVTDRMKASSARMPLIAVGGGSHLVPDSIDGVSEVIRPEHHEVANAYGAAIAEASGFVERIYRYEDRGREGCLDEARSMAIEEAVRAGADPAQVRITTLSEIPLSYVPGNSNRVLVKAAGPLRAG